MTSLSVMRHSIQAGPLKFFTKIRENCDQKKLFAVYYNRMMIIEALISCKVLLPCGKEYPMDDKQILDLYWTRSETAISETTKKYGRYCHVIAYNILHNAEDSEECVSETWLKAWNSMPPHRPGRLSAFLGKITRNLSLNRYRQCNAEKRGRGQVTLALDELRECIPAANPVEQIVDKMVLTDILNCFLASLGVEARNVFMRRYWYLCSVREIAEELHIGESKVKMILLRSRNELKVLLEKEGIVL